MTDDSPPQKVFRPEYRPPSYQLLNLLLGQADAGIEWLEVGFRHLAAESSAGGSERVQSLADTYGVKVNTFDPASLRKQWAHLQIVSVWQYTELFMDSFRREFPRQFRSRKSKESPVHYLLDILGVAERKAGSIEVGVLEYYRLVRNRFLHEPDTEEPRKISSRRDSLRAALIGSLYQRLNAPNEVENIGFDDFILFTRALKNFARNLCAHAQPTAEEICVLVKADKSFLRKVHSWQESPRIHAIVTGYLRQRFGPFAAPTSHATLVSVPDLLAQLVELPLQEPAETQPVAEGGGRGSSPRQVSKKGRGS